MLPKYENRHKTKKKYGWVLHPKTPAENSSVEFVLPENEKHFTLPELQRLVGGYFAIVGREGDYIVLANEDGLSMGDAPNQLASETYGDLCGRVAVIHKTFFK